MSGEEKEICELSLDSLLLMINLSEDDFIINVTLGQEDSNEEGE